MPTGEGAFRVLVDADDHGRAACLHLHVCDEELELRAARGAVHAEER